ncbi:PadR family transcriptional regulator [Anaerovorax odorimutans]|uniref:PadR family transcriptional regulator n=1 Tax=Anaerovorax odorimutans TaxID=109327 RepID=UPI0004170A25|nr:PadR family transcriptional regulator [Anaerovorax odorimutans]
MAREKFHTLTEQMFYILLCLQSECYGMDIMEKIRIMTNEQVTVGPGTLYNLLESFENSGMIYETKVEGRKRSYLITDKGLRALEREYQRLIKLTDAYQQYVMKNGGVSNENNKA